MPAGDVDDPAAAAAPADASRDLPRLEQFLAWQPSDAADDPADAVEQRVAGEATNVVVGEPALRAVRKAHVSIVARTCPKGPLHC